MIANLLDGWFKFDVGEGAFYALLGFAFVFVGIVLIIAIISLIGKIIDKGNSIKEKKAEKKANKGQNQTKPAQEQLQNSISPEVVAVISAAIASYYEAQGSQCGFVVKRIKRY